MGHEAIFGPYGDKSATMRKVNKWTNSHSRDDAARLFNFYVRQVIAVRPFEDAIWCGWRATLNMMATWIASKVSVTPPSNNMNEKEFVKRTE